MTPDPETSVQSLADNRVTASPATHLATRKRVWLTFIDGRHVLSPDTIPPGIVPHPTIREALAAGEQALVRERSGLGAAMIVHSRDGQ